MKQIILYRPVEVQKMIGISSATLYRYVRSGILRPVFTGGKILFNEKSIKAFANNTRK